MQINPHDSAPRLGIYTFDVESMKGDEILVKLINSSSTKILTSESLSAKDINRYGIHVHVALLEKGDYELVLQVDSNVIHQRFTTPELSMKAELIRLEMIEHGTPLIFAGPTDSSHYPYSSSTNNPWFDRPDAENHISQLLANKSITDSEAEQLKGFVKDGYILLENAISNELISKVNVELDEAIEAKYLGYEYGSSDRLEHLHYHNEGINDLWLNPTCRHYVELLFDGIARPSQTLIFVFGSQQDAHQDAIHLTPFPSGYMCGAWIALQDVEADSGELVVYPGSHREPRLRMSDLKCTKVAGDWTEFGKKVVPAWEEMAANYESFVYQPKKGTVLIWHENLLHAGSLRKDKSLERRSCVIHYFSNDSIAYYDSTGMPGFAAPVSILGNSKSNSLG